jgi:hypothetical protein
MALEMDKKEIRNQVNEILGWELSDEEAQGIDFSGIIEDIEPNSDDFSKSLIGPLAIIAGGMTCYLLGISVRDRIAFLGVYSCAITVSVIFGWVYLWRKKRAKAKKEILEAIQKYEKRASYSK